MFHYDISMIGVTNGYFLHNDTTIPKEIAFASITNLKKKGYITIDYPDTIFSEKDEIVNRLFSEVVKGLPFPPPKDKYSIDIRYVEQHLKCMHSDLGGGKIGCRKDDALYFKKRGLPAVDITLMLPPYDDLQNLPEIPHNQFHSKENFSMCALTIAARTAFYMAIKYERIKNPNDLVHRFCALNLYFD